MNRLISATSKLSSSRDYIKTGAVAQFKLQCRSETSVCHLKSAERCEVSLLWPSCLLWAAALSSRADSPRSSAKVAHLLGGVTGAFAGQ